MTIELKIPEMTSGACAKIITQAVIDIDPRATVKADIKTKQVIVESTASDSSIKEAITSASYPPSK